ncbi:MAG: glycosyltransferase family 2 protein, partial [Segetibacter sp.]
FEIVVVDNGSADGSATSIKEKFSDVILIENTENTGAPAWNLGFAKAKGKYFIILDDDSHIDSGLEDAIHYLDTHADVGVLALNVITGPYTSEIYKWTDGQEIAGFIGCGAIVRRKLYEKIGGYADWIFLYGNEWEYCLRTMHAGYSARYFATCKVNHRASKINRTSKRLKVFCTQNEMAIVYRYFCKKRGKYLMRMLINGLKCIKDEGLKPAYYTLLGALQFYKMRKQIPHTPVSETVQNFFAKSFYSTQPIFGFLTRRLQKLKA